MFINNGLAMQTLVEEDLIFLKISSAVKVLYSHENAEKGQLWDETIHYIYEVYLLFSNVHRSSVKPGLLEPLLQGRISHPYHFTNLNKFTNSRDRSYLIV